ncbi:MAG TPA: PPOX class F420-dependent oxidoreductase [Pseudonocardiaceae bacterium]|nr:PPOX class F420-dependent oxidoreductase [Pseudonocardiaceae bacterium]
MSTLSPKVREALEGDHLAHMVTINPDGSPQVSCVWVGLEGDSVLSGHLFEQQKIRNLRRDPRISMSIVPGGKSPDGLPFHFVLHGKAEVVEGGCPELLQQLAETYLGPGVKWPPMDEPPPGFVIRTTVERVVGYGPWHEE